MLNQPGTLSWSVWEQLSAQLQHCVTLCTERHQRRQLGTAEAHKVMAYIRSVELSEPTAHRAHQGLGEQESRDAAPAGCEALLGSNLTKHSFTFL